MQGKAEDKAWSSSASDLAKEKALFRRRFSSSTSSSLLALGACVVLLVTVLLQRIWVTAPSSPMWLGTRLAATSVPFVTRGAGGAGSCGSSRLLRQTPTIGSLTSAGASWQTPDAAKEARENKGGAIATGVEEEAEVAEAVASDDKSCEKRFAHPTELSTVLPSWKPPKVAVEGAAVEAARSTAPPGNPEARPPAKGLSRIGAAGKRPAGGRFGERASFPSIAALASSRPTGDPWLKESSDFLGDAGATGSERRAESCDEGAAAGPAPPPPPPRLMLPAPPRALPPAEARRCCKE